jgi:hypothetical protein
MSFYARMLHAAVKALIPVGGCFAVTNQRINRGAGLYSISNVKRLTSNIERPTSNFECGTFVNLMKRSRFLFLIRCSALNV